ncbi:type I phosphomannose isomerase catalytic subunit [Aureivirga marina]|uniref:type I phosphomannose isomerase catalytic subunit n=1 Tax=Aureivirga marina TaxID=1182451 RepID=UPI00293D77B0|nr:type I phosphomannose isomerase catalytic subunit [Aureivirga marina]
MKSKIWGGSKLIDILGKSSDRRDIGESWEISDVENDISIISNGELKGKTLREVISLYKDTLVGDKVFEIFGEKFPLLIKFIDAKTTLSIQLHPDDKLARERHNSFGKTEMWYVMQADKDANLIVGFKDNVTKESYLKHLEEKNLLEILNVDKVSHGDIYYIPTGRIHAIGAGVMLAEIQQTSDITYRVYDWDRKDSSGNYRELHTNLAIDAINFKSQDSYKTPYQKVENNSTQVISCPYFTTNILPLNGSVTINHEEKNSFVIYMCVQGEATFHYSGKTTKIKCGETCLIPACLKKFEISSEMESELLEVYIDL